MRGNRQANARVAIEYVTARSSRLHDAASTEALEEAAEHVYELVDGLSYLVVGLALRAAAAEGLSVGDVLQREALTPIEEQHLAHQAAREEVPGPVEGERRVDTPVGDPVREPVRVRRLQPPKEAAAFLEIDEEPDFLRPDKWDS